MVSARRGSINGSVRDPRHGGRVRRVRAACAGLLLASAAGCGPGCPRLTIFYAASLDGTVRELTRAYREELPGSRVAAELSGSQVALRKVTDLGRRTDVVLVADASLIARLLDPARVLRAWIFATNEIVLAFEERSRRADEIREGNWYDVLLAPEVTLARADEATAPIGYRTLQVARLADRLHGRDAAGGLEAKLRAVPPGRVRDDVAALLPILGRGADYVFLYRNVAFEHNLPFLRLPPDVNLGDPGRAGAYAAAVVQFRIAGRAISLAGAPIAYGAAILRDGPDPAGAAAFEALLRGPRGARILRGCGLGVPARPTEIPLGREGGG